jgi:hypothetical protein
MIVRGHRLKAAMSRVSLAVTARTYGGRVTDGG